MPETATRVLKPLDFGGWKPHEGCARRGWPGGQVSLLQAALTTPFVSALWGRDTGKSVAAELLYWEEARSCPDPYENIYVAQGHPQAERTWEKFVYLCENAGEGFLKGRTIKGQDRWVETRAFGMNRGTRRHFWSGEPGALNNVRGPRGHRLVVDEAGMVHKSVLTSCVPMLGTRNGRCLFIGTASRGGCGFVWFKAMFERGSNKEAGYVSFNFPKESNPYLSDEAIARERSLFRNPAEPDVKTAEEMEECDGAFVSDLGAFLRNLDSIFTIETTLKDGVWVPRDNVHPVVGQTYVIGRDHGKKVDNSVSSVFCRETRDQVALQIEPVGMKYGEQMKRLDALKHRYNDALLVCDARDAGSYLNEQMRDKYGDRLREIAFTGDGPNSKSIHCHRIRDLCDNEGWHLLKVPEQVKQFSDFAQVPIGEGSNGYRYEAPSGGHDDTVAAAIFASTVLRFDVAVKRARPKGPEPLSPEWYLARQKQRLRGRRGIGMARGFTA